MTDNTELNDTSEANSAHHPTEAPTTSRTGHRMLYMVLSIFVLTQCAFVGYAHWFLTRGLPNALADVSDSDILKDVRALTESSLQGLYSPDATLPGDPLPIPDQQADNRPDATAPNAPFIQPDEEISVDNLLDIVESLTQDLDEQLRALEDPSHTPRPPGSRNDLLVPPGDAIEFSPSSGDSVALQFS